MDAVHELAEQSSDEMRSEIDCTRSDLADKLEALEERVMGTVQSAQEMVEDSIQMGKDTVAAVKHTFDIKHHVEQHPWAMVGGSALAGLALGMLLQKARRGPGQAPDRLTASPPSPARQRGNGRSGTAAPLPEHQSPPPGRPGLLDLFHDEIAKVQRMAIGHVMGLARDAIKDSMPHLAAQIDDVMNSVTTKLGGEPAPQGGH
jgi:ElaB/YqjD/DUF883 family membrane-anchored ribosome-binding protein